MPVSKTSEPRDRKAEHIRLALEERMQVQRQGWDAYRFQHVAMPELDLEQIDTSVEFLGKSLRSPLLISCMTGGTEEATRINRNLAEGAEREGIAVGVGSQRKALEDERTAESFRIRPQAPTAPILGNLGAVQLNYGYGVEQCEAAVKMIDADALVLHLNPLQEAIQPEGDVNFAGLLPKIAEVVEKVSVPVIAKEVGSGISRDAAEKLMSAGVKIVDTAGVGGTSWARIEAARADDTPRGELFADWGIPTPESIRACAPLGLSVIGSGGVRNGVDVAKAIALGADLAGMAFPLLEAALESPDAVEQKIAQVCQELKIAMFCVGAEDISELQQTPISKGRA